MDCFKVLILIGRPASGKSEIIDFLRQLPAGDRKERYRIDSFTVIDDFPMLWSWFEDDKLLTRMGRPRLHSDDDGFFKYPYLWHLLIARLELEYQKLRAGEVNTGGTAIIEFARGTEHAGYRGAFEHFSVDLLAQSAILYVDVSFEESLRKNRRRFNPDRPHSILEHALPDDKLRRLYGDDDWRQLSSTSESHLQLRGVTVPYAVFDNEDDVTTPRGAALGTRLSDVLGLLWDRRCALRT